VIANSFLVFGIGALAGDARRLHQLYASDAAQRLRVRPPRDCLVVEILETVKPDPEVVEACRRLKQHGYVLAL